MVGIHVSNADSVSLEFFCKKCNLLLREPLQTLCGHRLCRSCVDAYNADTFQCPVDVCQKPVTKVDLLIDRGIMNDMKQLKIACTFCSWNGQFKDYDNHLQENHTSLRCPKCLLGFSSHADLETHSHGDCTPPGFPCAVGNPQQNPSNLRGEFQNDTSIMRQRSPNIKGSCRLMNLFSTCAGLVDSSSEPQTTVNTNTVDRSKHSIWRITGVEKKTLDAENGSQRFIDSPPFYTAHGYKFCLRLYLDGDESARGCYASLFFVLMQGESDSWLSFPFHQKVLVCLYDQTEQRNHIISGFHPDIKSKSFRRPITEKNLGSGIAKCFPLQKIRETGTPYVQNDTMFIKVVICDEYIPESAIRDFMSINPGLPNAVHDRVERAIIDKASKDESDDIDCITCIYSFD